MPGLAVLSVAAAVLPIVVAAARAIARGWIPMSEDALYVVRARDVLTHHIPLVGTLASASQTTGTRINQPGPLLFDLLAIPVRLLGAGPGVAAGMAGLNAAAVVGVAVFAHRRGGALLTGVAMAAAAALGWSMGSEVLFEPWNPLAVIFPFLLFLFLVWSLLEADLLALPLMVLAGSLVAQTHLSYALLVPGLAVLGIGGVVVAARRRLSDVARSERWRVALLRASIVAAVVGVLCWAQPVTDALTHHGGNLRKLLSSSSASAPTAGLSLGARLVAAVVALPPWWLRPSFGEDFLHSEGWRPPGLGVAVAGLIGVAAVLLACALVARSGHDRVAASLVLTATVALALGVLTATRALFGPVAFLRVTPHVYRWLWPLSAFVTFAVVATLARGATRARRTTDMTLLGAVCLVAVLLGGLALPPSNHGGPNEVTEPYLVSVRGLARRMGPLEGSGPLLVDGVYTRLASPWAEPVIAELQRRGVAFVVAANGLVGQFGTARRFNGRNARASLTLATGDGTEVPPPGGRRVARYDALSAGERRELAALEASVIAYFSGNGVHLDPRGASALRHGRLPVLRQQLARGTVDPRELIRFGELLTMVRGRMLAVPAPWERRLERYRALRSRFTDLTVALFVTPLPSTSAAQR